MKATIWNYVNSVVWMLRVSGRKGEGQKCNQSKPGKEQHPVKS